MAYDVVKFVDSIASSPTTRLDVNDGAQWTVRDFSAPPPRLRRSAVSNAMTDGAYVSSSTYDARTLFLEVDLITTTQDLGATELQKLARELDRSTNYLMYQPNALTKPVFFKTWRSDFSDVVDVRVVGAYRRLSIELLAEPFALGLRETISVGTVTCNPASGSQGCYFDVTGVIGDVPAPCVMTAAVSSIIGGYWSTTRTQINTTQFVQAESMTLGTDTTNPGGGPDAAMSGTGTNNYRRTSFATATMVTRLSTTTTPSAGGTHRLIAYVRLSDATTTVNVRAAIVGFGLTAPVATLALSTGRQAVDLGLLNYPRFTVGADGTTNAVPTSVTTQLMAERVSGAGTLDWDFLIWVPAEEQSLIVNDPGWAFAAFDSVNDRVIGYGSGNPLTGTAVTATQAEPFTGSLPYLSPNVTNRFTWAGADAPGVLATCGVGDNLTSVSLTYNPRYLYVRPSTT